MSSAAAAPDKLYFHRESAAVPPGKGVHEQVADPAVYDSLWRNYPRWREALSDEWETPVQLHADVPQRYKSVAHVMRLGWQLLARDAADAKGLVPEAHKMGFELFCVRNDKSDCMDFPWMRLSPEDQEMWDAEKGKLHLVAQFAKFSGSPELRTLLLSTRESELWEVQARCQKPAERATGLEMVRAALREGRTEPPPEWFGADSGEEGDSEEEDSSISEER
jgi:hypothetical protein